MQDFTEWVLQNTVYPDVTYHNFLREQSANHDRIMEVGVHIGSSFIGMLRDRETHLATGLDMFMQNTEGELYANLDLFGLVDGDKVGFLRIINGYDHLDLAQQLGLSLHTFVHLDADHSFEGTLCELFTCHQALSVEKIIVHDLIDERVEAAVEAFRKWHNRNWNIVMVDPEVVFNGCVLMERKHE